MTPGGRWPEVERILDLVLDLSPEDSARVIDAECAGDPDLREQVRRALAADRDPAFLEKPAAFGLGGDLPDPPTGETPDGTSGKSSG